MERIIHLPFSSSNTNRMVQSHILQTGQNLSLSSGSEALKQLLIIERTPEPESEPESFEPNDGLTPEERQEMKEMTARLEKLKVTFFCALSGMKIWY
jgi:hypothetical protein